MKSTQWRRRILALALAWLTAAALAVPALADGTAAELPAIPAAEELPAGPDRQEPGTPDEPERADPEPAETDAGEEAGPPAEAACEEPEETEGPTDAEPAESPLPVLLAPPLPAVDGAALDLPFIYSSDYVQRRLAAMEKTYYEGYPWGNYASYYSPVLGGASACVGFANLMSDAGFDDLPVRTLYNFTYDDIHIGDQLWEYGGGYTHMVVVLEKYDDHVLLVEGNYNESVHWRRYKARSKSDGTGVEELYGVLRTRYPVHLPGDVNGDKLLEARDAVLLLQYLTGDRSGQDTTAADANSDGRVNAYDGTFILRMDAMKQDGLFLRPDGE